MVGLNLWVFVLITVSGVVTVSTRSGTNTDHTGPFCPNVILVRECKNASVPLKLLKYFQFTPNFEDERGWSYGKRTLQDKRQRLLLFLFVSLR